MRIWASVSSTKRFVWTTDKVRKKLRSGLAAIFSNVLIQPREDRLLMLQARCRSTTWGFGKRRNPVPVP